MRFFTKFRVIIIIFGLNLGLFFYWAADGFYDLLLAKDLFINLSASFLTIAIAVVLVDWQLNNERRLGNRDAMRLARTELGNAATLLLVPARKIYPLDIDGIYRSEDFPAILTKAISKAKAKVDTKRLKPPKDFHVDVSYGAKMAMNSLSTVMQNYAYALPDNLRGTILALHKDCAQADQMIGGLVSLDAKESADIISLAVYLGLLEFVDKMVDQSSDL